MALPFRRKAVSTDTLPAPEQLPKHIGFIMDGNGRWATKRGMPRKFGHREGAKTFHDLNSLLPFDWNSEYFFLCIFNRELEASKRRSRCNHGFALAVLE